MPLYVARWHPEKGILDPRQEEITLKSTSLSQGGKNGIDLREKMALNAKCLSLGTCAAASAVWSAVRVLPCSDLSLRFVIGPPSGTGLIERG